jgi:1-hydroxy-2-naphthoate dioxygenase
MPSSQDTTLTVSEFDEELRAVNLFGQWNAEAQLVKLTDGPKPSGKPIVWPYALVRAKLDEACRVFPDNMSARRNVTFITPELSRRGTTPTIIAGMQLVLPGEVAGAHRHSIAALRFVVEGDAELYTVVNGRREAMETNDLVLTPSYAWHDHHNESRKAGVWLDVLDVPLITALNQTFFQPFASAVQKVDDAAPAAKMRFPWGEMRAALSAAQSDDTDPFVGTRLAYGVVDGRHPLATLGCFAQMLPPAFSGRLRRHTPSTVYYVVAGEGRAVIGDVELPWSAKDTFAVPAWAPHRLVNSSASEEAVLFSVSDEPMLAALGLLREESPA